MKSSHTARLLLADLPAAACKAHLFPRLASGSLLSIGLLCDHGCIAEFTQAVVTIRLHGKIILTGTRTPGTKLWIIDVPIAPPPTTRDAAVADDDSVPGLCAAATDLYDSDDDEIDDVPYSAAPVPDSPCLPPMQSRVTQPSTPFVVNAVVPLKTQSERLKYHHASFGSPSPSTLLKSLKGPDPGTPPFVAIPGVTPKLVRKHLPPMMATAKGHLDQQRANFRSTKDKPTDLPASNLDDDTTFPNLGGDTTKRTHAIYASCGVTEPGGHLVSPKTGKVYSDPTGRFVSTSSRGNKDVLLIYEYDSNYIHVEPMQSRSAVQILAAYKRAIALFKSRGLTPQLHTMDNEASEILKDFLHQEDAEFQLTPTHIHRRNIAERCIRTFKNHFIAILCGTDPNFPIHLWDRLLPQTELTLNLLRGSRINPKLSAWAQVQGAFDYNRTPLAPPGTKILIHEKPLVRETWAPHGAEGFYLGPALDHYRCYRVYVTETQAERVADTLAWFPAHVQMPTPSSDELILAALKDVVALLRHPAPASPLSPAGESQLAHLQLWQELFAALPASLQSGVTAPPVAPLTAPLADTPAAPPAIVSPPPPGLPALPAASQRVPAATPPLQAPVLPSIPPTPPSAAPQRVSTESTEPEPVPTDGVVFTDPLEVPKSPAVPPPVPPPISILRPATTSTPAPQRVANSPEEEWTTVTYATKTINAGKRRRKAKRLATIAAAKQARLEAEGIAKAWKIRAELWKAGEQQAVDRRTAKQLAAAEQSAATKAKAAARIRTPKTSNRRRTARQTQRRTATSTKQTAAKLATAAAKKQKATDRDNIKIALHRHNTRFQAQHPENVIAALPADLHQAACLAADDLHLAACAIAACNGTTVPIKPPPPLPFFNTHRQSAPTVSLSQSLANRCIHGSLPPEAFFTANSVIDPETGAALEYRHLRVGPNAKEWLQGASNEIGRLAQGLEPNMKTGSNTMHFIHHWEKPADRKATYLRVVAEIKAHKEERCRIRFTVGGDRLDYPGRTATPTGGLTAAKCLFNSVVSTPGAKFISLDIKDYYLGTPMNRYEYMRIPVADIPPDVMEQYHLADKVHNGYVLVEIRKGMYGLAQSGYIANVRLQKHLLKYGYKTAEHTPGLFTHESNGNTFLLVVDGFGLKYTGEENAQHLINALKDLYEITVCWEGDQYCGLHLEWDYNARHVDLSMPGYIERALIRFQHKAPTRPEHGPADYTRPTYGAKTQLTPFADTSEPLDKAGLTRLKEIVGTLLYYARAVDSTLLVTLNNLGSAQATATEDTAKAIVRILNYCATHPDAKLRYIKSEMNVHVHTDASYLSATRARSRAGGIFFLSDKIPDTTTTIPPDAPPPPFNGAILVNAQILKVVVSSAAEAEIGAAFLNGKDAVEIRTILTEMGHPQGKTPIQTDNATACGIANDTIKQRRSKAIDMRFYWVRCRTN